MDDEEAQFLLDDEEEKPAKQIGSFRQTRVTSEATVKGRLHKTVDRKPPTPKAPPEKSPKSSSYNRGGKVGGKGGKFGSAGSKGKADKDKDKDDSKPKVTKARSAYNFYLLKRIAQLKEEGEVERHQDRFAQAAGEWRDMSFGERVPYEDMAKMDKDRHQTDLDTAARAAKAEKTGKCVLKHGQGICSGDGFPGLKPLPPNAPHDDVCAVCGEEGNLLCCDFCPKTHHLDCLVPPMQSLPQEHVMWACPACADKAEVKADVSFPLKRKQNVKTDDKKDDKKRPRTGNNISAAAASPKGSKDAGGTCTIPKRKKEHKTLSGTGSPRSLKEKRREKEEKRAALEPREEEESAAAAAAEGENSSSRNRMVKGMKQAKIPPRVGLGLSGNAVELSACPPDSSGSGGRQEDGKRSPMMRTAISFADAAASVAASAAATEAAAAAAAAPALSAPPKALGLKKLLHQRVQYDEIEAAGGMASASFSPKKLLKHRILAANNPGSTQHDTNSAESGAGRLKREDSAGNSQYHGYGDGRPLHDHWGPPNTASTDNTLFRDGINVLAVAESRRRPVDHCYADAAYRSGEAEHGSEASGDANQSDRHAREEGISNGRFVGEGSGVDRRTVADTNDRLGSRDVDVHAARGARNEGGWWGGGERTADGGGANHPDYERKDVNFERDSSAQANRSVGVVGAAMRCSAGRVDERDAGENRGFGSYERGSRGAEPHHGEDRRYPASSYRSGGRMGESENTWKGSRPPGSPEQPQRRLSQDYQYVYEPRRPVGSFSQGLNANSYAPPAARRDGDQQRSKPLSRTGDIKQWPGQRSGWGFGGPEVRSRGEQTARRSREAGRRGGVEGPECFGVRVAARDERLGDDAENPQHRLVRQDRPGGGAHADVPGMRNDGWRGGASWKGGERERSLDRGGRGDGPPSYAGAARRGDGNRREGPWMGESKANAPQGGDARDGGSSRPGGSGVSQFASWGNSDINDGKKNDRHGDARGRSGRGGGDGDYYGWAGRKRSLSSFDDAEAAARGPPRKHERLQNDQNPPSVAGSTAGTHGQHDGWNNNNKSASFGHSRSPDRRRGSREHSRGAALSSKDARSSDNNARDYGNLPGVGGVRVNGTTSAHDSQNRGHRMDARQDPKEEVVVGQERMDRSFSPNGRVAGHDSWDTQGVRGDGSSTQQCRSYDAITSARGPDSARQDNANSGNVHKDGGGQSRGTGAGGDRDGRGGGGGGGHWKARLAGRSGFQGRGRGLKGRGERPMDARDPSVDWKAVELERKRNERLREASVVGGGAGRGAGRDVGRERRGAEWQARREASASKNSGGGGVTLSGSAIDVSGRSDDSGSRPGGGGGARSPLDRGRDTGGGTHNSSKYIGEEGGGRGGGGRDGHRGLSLAGGVGVGNDRRARASTVRATGSQPGEGAGGGRGGQRHNAVAGGYSQFSGPKPVSKARLEKTAGYASLAAQTPSRAADNDGDRSHEQDRDLSSGRPRPYSRASVIRAPSFRAPPTPHISSEVVIKGVHDSFANNKASSSSTPDGNNEEEPCNIKNRSRQYLQHGDGVGHCSRSPTRSASNISGRGHNSRRDGKHAHRGDTDRDQPGREWGSGPGDSNSRHSDFKSKVGPKPWKNKHMDHHGGGGRGRDRTGGGFGPGSRGGHSFGVKMDRGGGRGGMGRGGGRGGRGRFDRRN